MSEPTELRVAFAGAGRVAQLHARAIARTRGLRLVGVYDPASDRAAAHVARWGGRAYPSVPALLADGVDAVWVLTPAATHLEIADAVVAAGRHVLVEKPVAADPDGIRALADAAAARGVIALPGHNYVHLPEARRLVRQVRDGDLGTVRALFVTYALGHTEELATRYGPVLTELMIHHTYLALAALGMPTRVQAGASRPGWSALSTSDQAWMTWEYDDGPATSTAHLFATYAVDDYASPPQTFTMKALGTQGSAGLDWRSVTHRSTSGGYSVGLPLYEETYEHEVGAFRDAVLGRDEPISDLYDAARAAEILQAAEAAARTGASVRITRPTGADE